MSFKNFGNREYLEAAKLLEYYANNKLSNVAKDYFNYIENIEFNNNSGLVYLLDRDYNVLIYNKESDCLDLFITTPYDGREGFLSDLWEIRYLLVSGDMEYLEQFSNYIN